MRREINGYHYFIIISFALLMSQGCARPHKTSEAAFVKKYRHFDYCRMSVTRQSGRYLCGLASLTSVVEYWGQYVSKRGSHPK